MGIAAWIPNIKENSWTGFKMLPMALHNVNILLEFKV